MFAAVAAQAVGVFSGVGLLYVLGMVAAAVLVVVFVAHNRTLPGMGLVAIGFLLNAAAVAANGAMPVDPDALLRIGSSPASLYAGTDARHEPIDDATRLRALTDVIPVPVPLPVGSTVVSAGDLVLAAGMGVLVVNGLLRPPMPAAARPDPDSA